MSVCNLCWTIQRGSYRCGLIDTWTFAHQHRRWSQPSQLINGQGKVVAEFEMLYKPDRRSQEPEAWREPLGIRNYYVLCADVWGDARDEVILFGARGLCIYTNPRPLADPTQYNETLYTGM